MWHLKNTELLLQILLNWYWPDYIISAFQEIRKKNCTTIRRIWNVFLARVYIPIFHLNHVPTCTCAFEKYRIFVRNRIRLILTWSYNSCISRDSKSGKAYSRGLGHTIPRIDINEAMSYLSLEPRWQLNVFDYKQRIEVLTENNQRKFDVCLISRKKVQRLGSPGPFLTYYKNLRYATLCGECSKSMYLGMGFSLSDYLAQY